MVELKDRQNRRRRASCSFTHTLHDWTCERTFASLKVRNLKVRM